MVMLLFMAFTGMVMLYGRGARGKARESNCLSNVKQIAIASATYAADNDGFYPRAEPFLAIMPYMKNIQVLRCPAESDRRKTDGDEIDVSDADRAVGAGFIILDKTMEPRWEQVHYFLVPGLSSDDRPDTILVYDDVPDRHPSKSFNMARIDGSGKNLPAAQWPGPPDEMKEAPDEK